MRLTLLCVDCTHTYALNSAVLYLTRNAYACSAIVTMRWREGLGGGPIGEDFCQLEVYGGRQCSLLSMCCVV